MKIEVVRLDRTIDQRCANCGEPWRVHGGGGACSMRFWENGPLYWRDPRATEGGASA